MRIFTANRSYKTRSEVIDQYERPLIREGTFHKGDNYKIKYIYHLIGIEQGQFAANFVVPEKLRHTEFLADNYFRQKICQGRMTDREELDKSIATMKEIRKAGKEALDDYFSESQNISFISDASNFPYNEGHFVIDGGKILPLPEDSYGFSGKHHIFKINENGEPSFGVVDLESPTSISKINQGFFVAKIIHEGDAIRLLDEVPDTGQISISNFRGHIGQIFNENAYSNNDPARKAEIHTELLKYLSNPVKYREILEEIVRGRPVSFGKFGEIKFPLNSFNHTYWIESTLEDLYCLKIYPGAEVTFEDAPDLLFEIARENSLSINNAYIGTNGRDVRIITPQNGHLEAISKSLDNQLLGDYFDRPLSNFIVFHEKPRGILEPTFRPRRRSVRQSQVNADQLKPSDI